MHALAVGPGLVVADNSLRVLASNKEAISILAFPENPDKIRQLEAWLRNRIRAALLDTQSSNPPKFVPDFQSGKRTYLCRSFYLNVGIDGFAGAHPTLLLILERRSSSVSLAEFCERFGLTAREQDTVRLLLEGLTSKEIAQRMAISPNTVKAFIRLVMLKMNVSTRSGIIGKIVNQG